MRLDRALRQNARVKPQAMRTRKYDLTTRAEEDEADVKSTSFVLAESIHFFGHLRSIGTTLTPWSVRYKEN